LFFDSRLSGDGTVSCASCHRPSYAFSEPTPVSTGVRAQRGSRKAPALLNLAGSLYPHFFRDGRSASLEVQALDPITNSAEMGNTREGLVATLRGIPGYTAAFNEAFGAPGVTVERTTKALADYVRTRMSGNSAWDRWRRLQDESAVPDVVKRGHGLFFGRAGCQQCHVGASFTDNDFHNLGVGWDPRTGTFSDVGRWALTKRPEDRGAFKTPTLREVSKHAPYMHDGSFATLREVIEFYNRGGESNPSLDSRIRPLQLTEPEIDALIRFLEALEGEGYQDVAPSAYPQ
jgi:cytochrome c peroxidase